MIKILFVTADPTDLSRLRLQAEYADVGERLKLAKYGGKFELKPLLAATPQKLIQELIDFNPHIVYFSGHGAPEGSFLENQAGEAALISGRDLEEIFAHSGDDVSCVVFNSCYSRDQANAIFPYVHDVISTLKPVGDDMAGGFSTGFYQGLANGHDVAAAFQLGCSMSGGAASRGIYRHDPNPDRIPLDLRFPEHLPVMIGMRCTTDQFKQLTQDATRVMARNDFDEARNRSHGLQQSDYSLYYEPGWLPKVSGEWKQAILRACDIVAGIGSAIAEPKIYHFFIRGPSCYALGLGAALGTKEEVVVEHYQKNPTRLPYVPILRLTLPATHGNGPQIVKRRTEENFRHISVQRPERTTKKMYAALDFAPNQTQDVDDLALKAKAGFVHIQSNYGQDIPLDVDWLLIAREIITALLSLLDEGCRELHLFLSVPVSLAFAIGMGLDTRNHVAIHHWFTEDRKYQEVFRLNELVPAGGK